MQGNFKYPKIKKNPQKIVKITRNDQKDQKSIVSCYHIYYCIQKYTTHQFTYYIYYLFLNHFKTAKMVKNQQVHQKIQEKQFYFIYLNCFLLATHLNLPRLNKCD